MQQILYQFFIRFENYFPSSKFFSSAFSSSNFFSSEFSSSEFLLSEPEEICMLSVIYFESFFSLTTY